MINSKHEIHKLGFAALVFGASAIAFAPIFVRVSGTGPTATAFWRLFLAIPVYLAISRLPGKSGSGVIDKKPSTLKSMMKLCLPGIFFAGDLCFYHSSVTMTAVANATLMTNLQPIFVAAILYFFYKQKISLLFIAGLIIAFTGAFVLIKVSFSIDARRALGDILGMISGVCYAGYILSVKSLREEYKTTRIMLWKVISGAMFLLPVSIMLGDKILPATLASATVLVGYMLVSQISGQTFISYALGHLPADFASVTLLVQPVMAVLFAYIFIGEKIGMNQVAGGLMVLAGIRLAQIASMKTKVAEEPENLNV